MILIQYEQQSLWNQLSCPLPLRGRLQLGGGPQKVGREALDYIDEKQTSDSAASLPISRHDVSSKKHAGGSRVQLLSRWKRG